MNKEKIAQNILNVTQRSALIAEAAPLIITQTKVTDAQAARLVDLYQEWTVGETYKKGYIVRYEGELYRVGQPEITASNTYIPGATGTEVLYSHISIDPETGYEEWKEWDGVSGIYDQGQIVSDPFDNDRLYKSKIPNNVWGPPHEQLTYWELYTE